MKVLRLGTSQDQRAPGPGALSRQELTERELSRLLGEPATVVTRPMWPDARFPGLFARWLADEEPDAVYIPVNGYWFNFESVPLRLGRRFGRVGRFLARIGQAAGDRPTVSHNAAFRLLRRVVRGLVGGDTHFTTGQVVECVQACIREALRHEGTVVVVGGPHGGQDLAGSSRRARAREERRRREVTAALAAACAAHHVPFYGFAVNRREAGIAFSTAGDRLHYDEAGVRASALETAERIATEYRRAHDGTPAG